MKSNLSALRATKKCQKKESPGGFAVTFKDAQLQGGGSLAVLPFVALIAGFNNDVLLKISNNGTMEIPSCLNTSFHGVVISEFSGLIPGRVWEILIILLYLRFECLWYNIYGIAYTNRIQRDY